MKRSKPKGPMLPAAAIATRRQTLLALLEQGEHTLEQLRREVGLTAKLLEEELRHLERSLAARGRSLHVTPAACRDCGFVFAEQATRRLKKPSRCPKCKSEHIEEPLVSARSVAAERVSPP